ncbi:Alpha/Beta hydrolase protein [Hypoxylon trugodes]|uniref:Alpha/Beta hydrolase protein n=1 Tax=Hypoxylon trugodes TaxID=326681 RepID=UPI002193CC7F|nr:Alpha/Beta hydrolase protein [Hypoxylon trugodes]KAI1385885.1 Alpha/Beta hydrolase protein [Hypoxylon trugodes]
MSAPKQPRQTLKWDAEYEAWFKPFAANLKAPESTSATDLREHSKVTMTMAFSQLPARPSIKTTLYKIPSYDGVEIDVTRFATAEQTAATFPTPLPAVLYLHGGGMVTSSVSIYAPVLTNLAATSGVQFFGVEYRLAPEYPDPTIIEDCYAALLWISTHASSLGIDSSRLGVMGDSAGGGLAAGTTLLARDRGLDPPVKNQILVYPMLDDRSMAHMIKNPGSSQVEEFSLYPVLNLYVYWEMYLGKENAGAETGVSPYAAPGRATDLKGLPSTYMDVGGLDLFRDECATFAARLAAADVEIEFHLIPGVPHGFDVATEIGATKRAYEGRIRWIKSL